MDTRHQVENDYPCKWKYIIPSMVYSLWKCAPGPTARVLEIHSVEEGCFKDCGMPASCGSNCYTHFILLRGVAPGSANSLRTIGNTWVYHVTGGIVDWKFIRDGRILSPWMRAFVKSKRGL